MLDRRAQIGGGDQGHERKDCVEVIQSDLNRCNRRRQGRIEGFGHVLDLRERAVGPEDIKGGKAFFPIRKCAQKRKRGGRAQPVHAVFVADNMAAATLRQRQRFTHGRIPRKHGGLRSFSVQRRCGDRGFTVSRRVTVNRAPSDIGLQPVGKTLGSLGSGRVDFVDYLALLQDRGAAATLGQGQIAIVAQTYTDTCFQGKPRQDVLPETTVGKRFGNTQRHGLFIGFGG